MVESKGLKVIIKYISNNRGCVITTWQEDFGRGTPVYYFSNGTTIYIMSEGGEKFPNIRKNPKVTIGIYTNKPLFGVQLFGTAKIIAQDDPSFLKEVRKSGFLKNRQFAGEEPPYFLKIIKTEAEKIVFWGTKKDGTYKLTWDNTLKKGLDDTIYDKLIFSPDFAVKHTYPEKIKSKNPIIFLHDAFQGSFAFSNFQNYFAQRGWDNYALNLRGHFVSQFTRPDKKPSGGVKGTEGISEYVEDLRKIVSTVGKTPVIIGHGMGALIALKYAERFKTKGLVLLNPLPSKKIFNKFNLQRKITKNTLKKELALKGSKILSVARKDGEKFLFKNRSATDEDIFEITSQLCGESAKAFFESNLGKVDLDTEKIKTPLFVLGTKSSPISGAPLNSVIAKEYKARKCRVFEKIDHNFMVSKNWKRYASEIEKFLD